MAFVERDWSLMLGDLYPPFQVLWHRKKVTQDGVIKAWFCSAVEQASMSTGHAQLTTENHGSEENTWMAYSFHPGSWMCFASWRATLFVQGEVCCSSARSGLGNSRCLEGNSLGPLLCIHLYEHSVSCCWEGRTHSNEVRQLAVLQTKNHLRNKCTLCAKGSKTLAVAPT